MNAPPSRSAPRALAALSVALLAVPLCGQNIATAIGETTSAGAITGGSYLDTWASDGVYEALTERESGGRPRNRTSCLWHIWDFDVLPGSSVTLFVKAHHTANGEGDDFQVWWSSDGTNYEPLLDLTKTSDDGTHQSAALPATVSGPLFIGVVDIDRTSGNRSLDTLFVDHVYVESNAGGPPAAPADVVALDSSSSTIDISWTDMSVDEVGFAIERDGVMLSTGVDGPDITFFRDSGLLPSMTYQYVVYALNPSGISQPSNTAAATTRAVGSFAIDPVDVMGYPPYYKDLAYDPLSGHPAIVYSDGTADRTKFAQWNESSWDIEVVEDGGAGVSLAFSPSGTPSVAHTNGFRLRYLEKIGSVWIGKELDKRTGNDFPSLAYDSNGEPAISYYSLRGSVGSLKLARRSNGSWSTEVIDESKAMYSSLAFDLQGHPAIAYSTTAGGGINGVKLARWNGSTWDIELVESGVVGWGVDASLAFDPTTGWPAITHGHRPTRVRFLHWDGTSWQVEIMDGQDGRLAYDAFGSAYIAYVDKSGPGLQVARWDGVVMQHDLVSASARARPIALRIDPATQLPSVTWSESWGLAFARK